MIKETFYVANDERMNKVKSFIRQNMPTARFERNPYKYQSGKWEFNISYEMSDINKLQKILNEFHSEDNPPEIEKEGFWKKTLVLPTWILVRILIPILPVSHVWKNKRFTLSDWSKNSTNVTLGFSIYFWTNGICFSIFLYFFLT